LEVAKEILVLSAANFTLNKKSRQQGGL